MKEFSYVITDSEGIHARPAGLLVKKAAKFQSDIKLKKGRKRSRCKKNLWRNGISCKMR